MQLGDVVRAGRLVQAVDVLGDDRAEQPRLLERGDGVVAAVGLGAREALPPTKERAQYRCRFSLEAQNSPCCIGMTRRVPSRPR